MPVSVKTCSLRQAVLGSSSSYYTAPQRQLPFSVLIIKAPCGSATAARQLPPSGYLFETFTRQGPRYRAI